MAEKTQTHVNVLLQTQKQISILSRVQGQFGYELVEAWANNAWQKAKEEGLVTDAMLQPQKPVPTTNKKKEVGDKAPLMA